MAWTAPAGVLPWALTGVATGTAAAALNYVPIGTGPGLVIGGSCFGFSKPGGVCEGIDVAFYLFPGLVFGIVFGSLLRRGHHLTAVGAGLYAAAATIANAAAVFVCIGLILRIDRLLPFESMDLAMALSGLMAGAVGGGLLGIALAFLAREAGRALPFAAAAGLGLLTPLIPRFGALGHFAFYLLWQGGYAAALASSLRRPARRRAGFWTPVWRWLRARPSRFALYGAASGAAAAAAATSTHLGNVTPFEIAGYCLGVQVSGAGLMQGGGACQGIEGAVYLFPGLVFGLLFAPLLHFHDGLSRAAAAGYGPAALIANAAAVTVCVSLLHPVDDLLPFANPILDLAVAGAIAGAAGGALLGMAFAALAGRAVYRPAIAVAAALGVLTPLVIMTDKPGAYAFYMIWQGGYAAAVALSLPHSLNAPTS